MGKNRTMHSVTFRALSFLGIMCLVLTIAGCARNGHTDSARPINGANSQLEESPNAREPNDDTLNRQNSNVSVPQSHLAVLEEVVGDFIPDTAGSDRILIYYDPDRAMNRGDSAVVEEVRLSIGQDSEGASVIDPYLGSLGYRQKELEFLGDFSREVGANSSKFPVADLNANGIDELYFLRISGMGSWVGVWEWEDGAMVDQIADGGTVEVVTGLEMVGEIGDCPCGFRVYGLGRMEDPANVRDWVEYAWDADALDYVIVDSGLDEWEGNWFSDE